MDERESLLGSPPPDEPPRSPSAVAAALESQQRLTNWQPAPPAPAAAAPESAGSPAALFAALEAKLAELRATHPIGTWNPATADTPSELAIRCSPTPHPRQKIQGEEEAQAFVCPALCFCVVDAPFKLMN